MTYLRTWRLWPIPRVEIGRKAGGKHGGLCVCLVGGPELFKMLILEIGVAFSFE